MTDEPSVVRRVSWRDLAPWLVLFRVFRVSISPAALLLAFVGVVLTPLGWRAAEAVFLSDSPSEISTSNSPASHVGANHRFRDLVRRNRGWLASSDSARSFDLWGALAPPRTVQQASRFADRLSLDAIEVYWTFVEPFRLVFSRWRTVGQTAYLAAGLLWSLLVWSMFGGALTRIAVMRLGREERIGLIEACRDTVIRFLQYFSAPLFPLLSVVLLALPVVLLGLIMRLDVGVVLGGVFWWLVMAMTLIMVFALIGIFFGWPLMWGAISAEGSDAFDAVSRSFAYVYQRPLHYLFYALIAAVVGALGLLVVSGVCAAVEYLAWWSASWGMGLERYQVVHDLVYQNIRSAERFHETVGQPSGGAIGAGASMMRFFLNVLHTIVAAFRYSYFWCAAGTIYLLLRLDVDQKELDEVYVDGLDDGYSLPPISLDPAAPSTGENTHEN